MLSAKGLQECSRLATGRAREGSRYKVLIIPKHPATAVPPIVIGEPMPGFGCMPGARRSERK